MALTVQDKKVFRQMIASRPHSSALITIIDSGSSGAISKSVKDAIGIAIPNSVAAASVVSAIESGSALSEKAKRMIHRAAGSKFHGDNICTEINALS